MKPLVHRGFFYLGLFLVFITTPILWATETWVAQPRQLKSYENLPLAWALQATTDSAEQWEKKMFIAKAARLLRGGHGLTASDDLNQLLNMSDEQIVDHFMQAPQFIETVMQYNLYFLGMRFDNLHKGNTLTERIYSFPQAITAALEVQRGGDFFKILDWIQPAYMGPLIKLFEYDPNDDNNKHLTPTPFDDRAIRYSFATQVREVFNREIDLLKNPKDPNKPISFCDRQESLINGFFQTLFNYGFPTDFNDYLQSIAFAFLGVDCKDTQAVLNFLPIVRDNLWALHEAFLEFEPDVYRPKQLGEIKTLDLSKLRTNLKWMQFGSLMRGTLLNSSTNYNRKRAAYVLKQFFCDDLTPIGVEDPGSHAGDRHASTPECMVCHYKLDPMAGFFKNLGISFNDFSGSAEIVFDDMARMPLDKYQNAWLAPQSSGRKWDIGYVRSTIKPELNDYGESMEDLFAIIKKAPEVKQCMVRRMFEFLVAPNQVIDGGYLNYLTEQFNQQATTNSVQAFKALVKSVVLSQSFRQTDLQAGECYDFAPGATPDQSPPCRVAYLLQTNCKSCHSGPAASADLDLSQWVMNEEGVKSFPHYNDQGQPFSRQQTLEMMLDRINTTDLKLRMPKDRYMSAQEREELYLWLQEMLQAQTAQSGGRK